MKKSIIVLSFLALAFTGCKKEEVKPSEHNKLEEVPLEEKVAYTQTLEWTAFKTPEKIGVKGTFNDIKLNNVKDSGNLLSDLKEATYQIETSTVNTTDGLRDEKLRTAFFAVMSGNIHGKFIDFKDGKATVEITMNNVTKEKEFGYTATDDMITISGSIDIIADFQGTKAFNSLHELCKELHMGKTWTDVEIKAVVSKK